MNCQTVFEKLSAEFPKLKLRRDVSYREVTTLGAGMSKIALLAEVSDDCELAAILKFLAAEKIPFFLMGGGSNLVGSDEELDAVVLRLSGSSFTSVRPGKHHVTAGVFVRLPELARQAAKAGFGGLSALAGIPGTLGGALRMNAGANGECTGSSVLQLTGVTFDGSVWTGEKSTLEFAYRKSSIPENVIVTAAILELPACNPAEELAKIEAEQLRRREAEPSGRTAGCTFKNVSSNESAGKLIDQCGLKNYRIGAFAVSDCHANYIVNTDPENARESDYVELVTHIRRAVAEKFGFYLLPEVRFVNPGSLQKILDAVPPLSVCVLDGGTSSERDVSLRSGAAVSAALKNCGYNVTELDTKECKVYPEMRTADVIYPVLHGGFGEDGRIQACMEAENLRFVGSGSVSSLLTMDKIATKKLLDKLGIPTAKWAVVTPENRAIPEGFSFPVILKVPKEGSTIGIIKVDKPESWNDALEKEFLLAHDILAEEFVKGVEITVPVVGGEVLPAIEIRSPHGFYDYDAKYVYNQGHTQYFCPVETPSAEEIRKASELARKFYLGAGCRDLLRVDFIIGEKDRVPYVLEGNSLPGCTATSLVPKSAKVSGMSFEKMTSGLVQKAMHRHIARQEETRKPELPVLRVEDAPARKKKIIHWLYRAMLFFCAVPLFVGAWCALTGEDRDVNMALILGIPALMLILSETFFRYIYKAGEQK